MKGIAAGERRQNSILIRNLAGSEEAIASVIEEAAAIRANQRIRIVPAGKQDVLRATGRSIEPERDEVKHVADCELMRTLRKAANL